MRVVVVRGAGPSFSAGLDRAMFTASGVPGAPTLQDLAALPAGEAETLIAGYQDAFRWLGRPELVSIAAVQGHAVGAGFQLALACDLRVLSADAQLTMAEPTLGLVPDLGGTRALVTLVGPSRALEICLTGRRVPASEALQLGLATAVVPRAELDAAVDDLVAALLAVPVAAARETKALLCSAAGAEPAAALAAERGAQLRLLRALALGAD